jgi:mercuric ion transport protein
MTAGPKQRSLTHVAEHYARLAYVALAWLFVACLVVQVFLVGVDLFTELTDGAIHRDFAYLYGWLAPALVLLATVGRLPLRLRMLTGLLLVLFAIQIYLPTLGSHAPMLAALHGVNALVVFWLAIVLARNASTALRSLRIQGG